MCLAQFSHEFFTMEGPPSSSSGSSSDKGESVFSLCRLCNEKEVAEQVEAAQVFLGVRIRDDFARLHDAVSRGMDGGFAVATPSVEQPSGWVIPARAVSLRHLLAEVLPFRG